LLDKKSNKFIQWLKTQPDYAFSFHRPPDSFGNLNEILSIVNYLESIGYVEIIRNFQGLKYGAKLTHIAVHSKEFSFLASIEYIKEKWIDIIALLISVLALIGAYRNEISAVIQKLMK